MKKFSVLIALVLLAVAGTGYAVTCSYDNVPAATLLVPYFKVSLNGATDFPIPSGGTDTLVSVVNVSSPGVIAHVTVWNKYSKAVIDFNLPLTGKDTVSFSMRDILNGKLSPNLPQYDTTKYPVDPCGLVNPGKPSATYQPSVGWGQTQFIRFSHPEAINLTTDVIRSISQYNLTAVDAIGALFRPTVWDSLDESGDISSWTTSKGANILDVDNPQCGWSNGTDSVYKDALSGYLTIDVVNYCTNYFPDQAQFYNEDAIATIGWGTTYTPNVLVGDIFFVDTAANGGNISGDPAVALEFDSRLPYTAATKTFFGKFVATTAITACANEGTVGCAAAPYFAPASFVFAGDGREPLGDHYAFRYLADASQSLQSWIQVWRSDLYGGTQVNLCAWANPTTSGNKGAAGSGFYDAIHQVGVLAYDADENLFGGVGIPPGPSGQPAGTTSNTYIFLESQRINLAATADWNPAGFKFGWVDLTLRGATLTGASAATGLYNMGWVGVQHTAPGAFISVGHAASNLNNQFQCQPALVFGPGNTP
ncbi:MAG TPA: hypothetical protein VGM13_09720 [Thermoanaerobaculia bacterium]|jgi:hypothetical protein